jgi:cation diffusion facilitator CzcD-associated flavoprotein CzcO
MIEPEYQVGIVGAGFSGVIAALRLKHAGRDSFVIFERAERVGGTWRDNTYPGCACDVPSLLYSISFAPKPDWSRMYGGQAEILSYLEDVVRTNDLGRHIRFSSEIVQFEFLEDSGVWRLTDRAGRSTTVRSVIVGTGPFNRPKKPAIPGADAFRGAAMHSARWDASVELSGKRVAVIGTGASAIQIVPSIAPEVAHLTVFQRSAAWIGDRMDTDVPESYKRVFRRYPWLQRLARSALYRFLEIRGRLFIGDRRLHRSNHEASLKKLEREVRDPELRRKLTPTYAFGCKRILSSDDYLPCFNRENVSLETDPINQITERGIRTNNGTEHELDVIIYATGFEVADYDVDAKILGLNGRELIAEWRKNGLAAYRGASVAGYPNLNFMLGPNTGLGHSSMIVVMEAQMNYIMDYLRLLERGGEGAYLDLKPEVQRAHNDRLQQQFVGTVWAAGCNSWYENKNGKITTLYPRLLDDFRFHTRRVAAGEYTLARG